MFLLFQIVELLILIHLKMCCPYLQTKQQVEEAAMIELQQMHKLHEVSAPNLLAVVSLDNLLEIENIAGSYLEMHRD